MPDDEPERADEAVAAPDGPANERWHLEPYDPDVDDAPKGDADDCNGRGDPVEDTPDGGVDDGDDGDGADGEGDG